MNAIEYKEYGTAEVLEFNEVVKPKPTANEVLIRVYSSTVTAADIMMRKGKPVIGRLYLGLKKPKRTILGFEFAGEVVEIGNDVNLFKPGDKVFGGTTTLGCYSEYTCVSEHDVITTMPENISYEEAAPVSGSAITVFNFLVGMAKIKNGQKILIIGASGGLGTDSVNLVKTLGADFVIDYTKADFTENGEQYDIIFDTVNKRSYSQCQNSIVENGIYLPTVFGLKNIFRMLKSLIFGGKKVKSSSTGMLPVKTRLIYFEKIKELLRTGEIKTVIDKKYSLRQMGEAHLYVEKGHKKGNVVINV
jgi:NADPH:quinone reductase-like Zn-dependent oxidoreductase